MTTKKERAQSPCETAPESNTQPDSTEANERPIYHPLRFDDPVAGWHELANPARRNRKSMRRWRRRDGGAVQGDLLALLTLTTVAGVLLVGVVR